MAAVRKLTLYGSPQCCLCSDALQVLEQVRNKVPFELELVDISGDALLAARYGNDIPVLCIDGEPSFKHRIDGHLLLGLLGGA